MIVNTEVHDYTQNGVKVLDQFGRPQQFLYISYVGQDHHIKPFLWMIPQELMYQWKYATKNDTPDPYYVSWDNKPVVKAPITNKFSEQRIHEMMLDLEKWFPDNQALKDMHTMYIPETAYMDIEVDVDDDGFPEAKDAKNPLNTVAIVIGDIVYVLGRAELSQSDIEWIQKSIDEHCERFDTKYKFVYRYHANEMSLMNDMFFNFIAKIDCVTGWNIFGYDWPYIYNRANNIGLDITSLSPTKTWYNYKPQDVTSPMIKLPMHKCIYDYMELYKKHDKSVNPKVSNKLDWVGEKVLGVKKVVHQLGFKEMWQKQKKEYVFYNAIDSILVKEIDKKLKTSSVLFGLASLMHCPVLTTYSSTKSIEIVQAEYLYRENKVFPTTKRDKDKKEYEGAFVFQPIPGIYRNVYCLDYASLYPTTMRQFNISPDTLLFKDKNYVPKENEIKCTNGCVYTSDFEGFIPKILSDFFAKRKEYKKKMVSAQKEKYHLIEILKEREKKLKDAV